MKTTEAIIEGTAELMNSIGVDMSANDISVWLNGQDVEEMIEDDITAGEVRYLICKSGDCPRDVLTGLSMVYNVRDQYL